MSEIEELTRQVKNLTQQMEQLRRGRSGFASHPGQSMIGQSLAIQGDVGIGTNNPTFPLQIRDENPEIYLDRAGYYEWALGVEGATPSLGSTASFFSIYDASQSAARLEIKHTTGEVIVPAGLIPLTSLGSHKALNVAHNSLTSVATIQWGPGQALIGVFLVAATGSSANCFGAGAFLVYVAWDNFVSNVVGAVGNYGANITNFTFTGVVDTTAGTLILKLTQANTFSQALDINLTITPLVTNSMDPITVT